MKFSEYVKDGGSIAELRRRIVMQHGHAPSVQTFRNILEGKNPSLETAVLIVGAAEGLIDYPDLLCHSKYIKEESEENKNVEGFEVDLDNLIDSL
jgi:hypothetical protein